jgi:hypothetical protein
LRALWGAWPFLLPRFYSCILPSEEIHHPAITVSLAWFAIENKADDLIAWLK